METFTVTLTLEVKARSREALQELIDNATVYDLLDMAQSINSVVEPAK